MLKFTKWPLLGYIVEYKTLLTPFQKTLHKIVNFYRKKYLPLQRSSEKVDK